MGLSLRIPKRCSILLSRNAVGCLSLSSFLPSLPSFFFFSSHSPSLFPFNFAFLPFFYICIRPFFYISIFLLSSLYSQLVLFFHFPIFFPSCISYFSLFLCFLQLFPHFTIFPHLLFFLCFQFVLFCLPYLSLFFYSSF